MRPRFNFRIHTVTVISLAFIFRLLFVNMCVFTSLKTVQPGKHAVSYFSTLFKKRKQNTEEFVKSNFDIYSAVEACEENPDDEDDLVKAGSPVLLSSLYFLFKRTEAAPGSNSSFIPVKYSLHPKKYLTLSILRI